MTKREVLQALLDAADHAAKTSLESTTYGGTKELAEASQAFIAAAAQLRSVEEPGESQIEMEP